MTEGAREVETPTVAAESYEGLGNFLRRVRDDMGADTATLLLVDSGRTILEPAATVGLDRTLRGARRVPIGRGFAGRVAQTRQPVLLSHVTPSNVINPVLLDHGVRALLGVPVVDSSELLGVLHVGFRREHEFVEAEKGTLTEFANQVAVLLRDRILRAEHAAALTLQRSLLPSAIFSPPGIAMAARYVPASGDLGGDWYDVFELPDERLVVVMGDVEGHGLDSAIVMGRLRSALRAYALYQQDPAEVLRRLDRQMCHFEPDVLATVLIGMAEPPYEEWCFSSAGHYPPLVGELGQPAAMATIPRDRLLGVDPDAIRRHGTVRLPADGYFCLFTDGLVERRPQPGEGDIVDDNLDRITQSLAEFDDPEMGCIRILSDVVGDQDAQDDIAVLVAQRVAPTLGS
ncbi:MAG TPA: GAF domain-containing SpoIIE family protein phosphatase [Aeromicrobium sp.]|nr:GAF domain-containing SpoIIE family protein phosphatase [Aeromicrobium sp.]